MISIVLPVLNEEKLISKFIIQHRHIHEIELIFVDGGSYDQTVPRILRSSHKLIQSIPNRAVQMNLGAQNARFDLILFLHVDSLLPKDFVKHLVESMKNSSVILGAFQLSIHEKGIKYSFIEFLVKLRCFFFKHPYNDQGLFVRKSEFLKMGGYPEIAFMEDYQFVKSMKNKGNILILPQAVQTSSRRWKKYGVLKTTLTNQICILTYKLGVAPEKIKKYYTSGGNLKKLFESASL